MLNIYPSAIPASMTLTEIPVHIGKIITIHGMIYRIRKMSGFAFILLQTRDGILQGVYQEDYAEFALGTLKENMSVQLTGEVLLDKRSRLGVEIKVRNVKILSTSVAEPPIVINHKELDCSLETLLDYRPLTLRHPKERAIFTLQSGIGHGIRQFLHQNRFTEIHTPKIVYSGAEGGANIFPIDYFGRKAFLAQSPQFYKQMMMGVYERVYEIAPVFRAEKYNTSRHINEYTSVDLEMSFIESFYQLCQIETKMLAFVFDFLQEEYPEEIALLDVKIPTITEIPAIPFLEAKQLIAQTYGRAITDFEDFEPEEEKLLSEIILKETGSEFVFVTYYKSSKRPFYAMDNPENPQLTESFDLIFRGLEITTGGQRIHDYSMQIEKMQARGMDPSDYQDYLMAHQHGLPPHGGLGLGLERLTEKLLGFQNIRRATLFPRDVTRLTP